MKFIDEAIIRVVAGSGGDGCCSFLRAKHRPKGGPDGGDGGDGGSVYLVADRAINTLADFRYTRLYKAARGHSGAGRQRCGRNGQDRLVRIPLGTLVSDAETTELIGDGVSHAQKLLVAAGGQHGLGNARFKSSVNQTPRKSTLGKAGDARWLRLELKVLADVGLLGLPNAGKSTFLGAVSNARPKVADYPFTTLHPHLGMVDVGPANGFTIADIPGLIQGAADGAGLGIRFLKHLTRTRVLLHFLDGAPADRQDAVTSVRDIEAELGQFDASLPHKLRWLVINKTDLLADHARHSLIQRLRRELNWHQPIYAISSVTGQGCKRLIDDLSAQLRHLPAESAAATHYAHAPH